MRRKKVVAFFHPYTNDGGSERVFWCAVRAVQEERPDLDCVFYTGDYDASPASLRARAADRFGVELLPAPREIDCCDVESLKKLIAEEDEEDDADKIMTQDSTHIEKDLILDGGGPMTRGRLKKLQDAIEALTNGLMIQEVKIQANKRQEALILIVEAQSEAQSEE